MKDAPFHSAHDYFVSLIDILGFSERLKGFDRVPSSAEERDAFQETVNQTVGQISYLQLASRRFTQSLLSPLAEENIPASFNDEQRHFLRRTFETHSKCQHWSDGLLLYARLETDLALSLSAFQFILIQSGILYLLALSNHIPIRGAITLGWGVETGKSELVGAAIAKAHKLETERAAHPRIVVDPSTVSFLESIVDAGEKPASILAIICMSYITKDDFDGQYIVNTFGGPLLRMLSTEIKAEIYKGAKTFIVSQLDIHVPSNNHRVLDKYKYLAQALKKESFILP